MTSPPNAADDEGLPVQHPGGDAAAVTERSPMKRHEQPEEQLTTNEIRPVTLPGDGLTDPQAPKADLHVVSKSPPGVVPLHTRRAGGEAYLGAAIKLREIGLTLPPGSGDRDVLLEQAEDYQLLAQLRGVRAPAPAARLQAG